MKIIELRAENVKGLVAIDITPNGDLVEIAGKNGAGKSSVLDAIWLALGGKEAGKDITAALRNGQDKGFVELTLDDGLIVHRGWSRNAEDVVTTSLKVVRDKDGIKSSVGSPQTTLDALRAITLDPEGFLRLAPRQQREALLAALAEAKVPLDGLGISEDGVTFQGVPLGDVNTADQIKVVLHVIAALNPRLRIIQIRQGSLLDEDSLSAVREFAADKDFQIWVEVVGNGSEDAINITAGEVAV